MHRIAFRMKLHAGKEADEKDAENIEKAREGASTHQREIGGPLGPGQKTQG